MRQLGIAIFVSALLLTACNSKQETTTTASGNPVAVGDIGSTVNKQLDAAGLDDVHVSVDKDKQLITLTGNVKDDQAKEQAAKIAHDNATTFNVANEIGVQPEGMKSEAKDVSKALDDGIESNFKAMLISHNMNGHSVRYKSINQTLELDGSVKSASIRDQLQALARTVPNVKEVVNKVEVK